MTPRRNPARPGLSYVDANSGRLITEGPDVQDLKAKIRDKYPDLECWFDVESEDWVIVEHCKDGIDRLAVHPIRAKDFREEVVMPKLDRADQASRNHKDPLEEAEKFDAQQQRDEDHRLYEICGDVGERLIHAFKKDGLYDHGDIYGSNPKVDRRRIINK